MSDDGYPTEEELKQIAQWDDNDLKGWLEFIGTLWHFGDWGWSVTETLDPVFEQPVRTYQVSTGGWSGNEEIIRAMQEQWMLWHRSWKVHRTGGHFTFEVPL